MPKKPKFKPVITRVKLNPEQAVLTCSCYDNDEISGGSETGFSVCVYANPRKKGEVACTTSPTVQSS